MSVVDQSWVRSLQATSIHPVLPYRNCAHAVGAAGMAVALRPSQPRGCTVTLMPLFGEKLTPPLISNTSWPGSKRSVTCWYSRINAICGQSVSSYSVIGPVAWCG
jgi:hypothetical protein